LPGALRSLLLELFGEAIDSVRLVEHSWIALLLGRPLAVTWHQRIYLDGSADDFHANPELVLHEYFHVLRQWQTGELTIARYVMRLLRHGYWNNPYEVEARAFAARHVTRITPRVQPRTRSLP
jgi:hypothetical protein